MPQSTDGLFSRAAVHVRPAQRAAGDANGLGGSGAPRANSARHGAASWGRGGDSEGGDGKDSPTGRVKGICPQGVGWRDSCVCGVRGTRATGVSTETLDND